MTEEQFLNKVDELSGKTAMDIRTQARKLLKKGIVDLGKHEDDYSLPKAFLSAACQDASQQWEPLDIKGKQLAKSLALVI